YGRQPVGIPRAPSRGWVQSSTTTTSAPAASASPARTAIIPRLPNLLTRRCTDAPEGDRVRRHPTRGGRWSGRSRRTRAGAGSCRDVSCSGPWDRGRGRSLCSYRGRTACGSSFLRGAAWSFDGGGTSRAPLLSSSRAHPGPWPASRPFPTSSLLSLDVVLLYGHRRNSRSREECVWAIGLD